ncbi:hypothetical protein ACFOY2_50645 [Nonomuraea purpurea]|uniref:Uncharacterized protein n=1 Tax=Nonomuraea purpurea TaxID=1849276 RepID=A0ABV8GS44_9ACTN
MIFSAKRLRIALPVAVLATAAALTATPAAADNWGTGDGIRTTSGDNWGTGGGIRTASGDDWGT